MKIKPLYTLPLLLLFLMFGHESRSQASATLKNIVANPGEIVFDSLMVTGFTDIGSFTLNIRFKPSVVTFIGITTPYSAIYSGLQNDSTINLNFIASTPPYTYSFFNGLLVKLKFEYIGPGTSPLTFLPSCEVTAGITPIPVTYTNGSVSPVMTNKTVNLNLFLEALYAGSGTMRAAQDESGPHWGATVADRITVELHSGADYATLVHSVTDINLSTSGIASFTVPAIYNGSYYLAILHRNSILTVTGSPLSFSSGTVTYNMTDLATKAFSANMALMNDGKWALFAGDASSDGLVDTRDFSLIDNDSSASASGYLLSDVNGDSFVDTHDLTITNHNAQLFISAMTP